MTTSAITFFSQESTPIEMHKARVVQRINLLPIDERLKAIQEAGNNTFLLRNRDVFLDMLTDSGTNAMSDHQLAAMNIVDDSYAGGETFYRLEASLKEMFGKEYFIPAHQGRACENLLSLTLVKPGQVAIMNYHFTTTKAHITRNGGTVVEVISEAGLQPESNLPFKGNFDLVRLEQEIEKAGAENVCFVRIEAGTNLIGGQPVSLENMREVSKICKKNNIKLMLDASLLADNLYFIKTREAACADMELKDIVKEMASYMDIIYFSARKLGCAKGGGIVTNDKELLDKIKPFVTLFEGFLTYGGMSSREMEAVAVGLRETLDFYLVNQTPIFVEELGNLLTANNVPIVTPTGGLGCHLNASKFVDHLPQSQYPAGALTAAIYLISGIRGMERGTIAEQRNPDGTEQFANMELVRLAVPKRVFTLSHMKFVADRLGWLYKNRHLIGGLQFTEEPETLRFFLGRLQPIGDWQEKLVEQFKKDMPNGL